MYIPAHFEVRERDELFRFISEHAFGQLVSTLEDKLFVSHLPFFVDDRLTRLLAHVAKDNPQWRQLSGQEVLVTFLGEHGYVSPSWYTSPGVPTWNYRAVHVYGHARVFTDSQRLASLLEALTDQHESGFQVPWRTEYAPRMLNAIVGVEIEIREIQGKYKLSQNRPLQDRHNIVGHLEASGYASLARVMKV